MHRRWTYCVPGTSPFTPAADSLLSAAPPALTVASLSKAGALTVFTLQIERQFFQISSASYRKGLKERQCTKYSIPFWILYIRLCGQQHKIHSAPLMQDPQTTLRITMYTIHEAAKKQNPMSNLLSFCLLMRTSSSTSNSASRDQGKNQH